MCNNFPNVRQRRFIIGTRLMWQVMCSNSKYLRCSSALLGAEERKTVVLHNDLCLINVFRLRLKSFCLLFYSSTPI